MANPAAHDSVFPPNVLKYSMPLWKEAEIASVVRTAAPAFILGRFGGSKIIHFGRATEGFLLPP